MCLVRKDAIKDWIQIAISRAKQTSFPTLFWLDKNRPHDLEIIKVVKKELKKINTSKIDIQILSPYEATVFTLNKVKEGKKRYICFWECIKRLFNRFVSNIRVRDKCKNVINCSLNEWR